MKGGLEILYEALPAGRWTVEVCELPILRQDFMLPGGFMNIAGLVRTTG